MGGEAGAVMAFAVTAGFNDMVVIFQFSIKH